MSKSTEVGIADYAVGCPTCLSVCGKHFPLYIEGMDSALATLHAAHRTVEALMPAAKEAHDGLLDAESAIVRAMVRGERLSLRIGATE